MLRGINLGSRRRVAMPALRELLSGAGYEQVQSYVQSGNVVLGSDATPDELERECARLISDRFGFEVPVVVRTGEEMARVVALDPLAGIAEDPKRYQVSFLSQPLDADTAKRLSELAVASEEVVVEGREIYAWHPDGVARSKLWNRLASGNLGVTATARNWITVQTLARMAGEP